MSALRLALVRRRQIFT